MHADAVHDEMTIVLVLMSYETEGFFITARYFGSCSMLLWDHYPSDKSRLQLAHDSLLARGP